MTKDLYKKIAGEKIGESFVNHVRMPELLREAAVFCFLRGDTESDFALITKEKLLELASVGFMNWD